MTTPTASVPHRRHLARWLCVAVLTVLTVGPWTAGPTAASAGCDGVTVLVERASGSTIERCAPGRPSDGLAALTGAGFHYEFVPGQQGFVCTIDRFPDPCNGAPSDAYWSYWSAEPGASGWTYNTRGGANRTPPPGSSDAWVFGAGQPPSAPPPAAPAPTPEPSPTPTTPPDTDASDGGDDRRGSSAGASTGGDGSRPAAQPSSADPPDAPPEASTPPDASSAGQARSEVRDDDSDDDDGSTGSDGEPGDPGDPALAGADEGDGGTTTTREDGTDGPEPVLLDVSFGDPAGGRSAIGPAVGGLLIVGLAGAGILQARRRRRDEVL
ncbi:MAG: hypothetical protein WEB03_07115 [Nitriliruptor sp.]|uniref:hypothetical protein n=1 Tax=Nitriliruptor sp. TaxID=2448056 RepID=UPI0034A0632C